MPAQKSSKSNPDAAASPDDAARTSSAPNGSPRDSVAESAPPKGERDFLEDAENMMAEACEQVLRAASRVSEAAGEATGSAREYAKKHPGGALLVSFLVGVILGALTSRR